MAQERPFYVSDEVLNTALIGITNKKLDVSKLPPALTPAVAALTAQGLDPADEAWALTSLVFAYESAYIACPTNSLSAEEMAQYRAALEASASASAADASDGAAAAGDNEILARVKLHQGPMPVAPCANEPEGQQYLSSQFMAHLNEYGDNPVMWLALLTRVQNLGLKVPPSSSQAFVNAFLRLRSRLQRGYQAVPLEFCGTRARYLMPYRRIATQGSTKAELDGELSTVSSEAVLEDSSDSKLITQWRLGSAAERKGALSVLLQRHKFELLLDLIEADFKTLAAKERSELLEVLFNNWLQVLSYCYQQGLWSASDAAQSAVQTRFASWLLDLVQNDRSSTVKAEAAKVLRLMPGGPWEADMKELVGKVFVATWNKKHLQRSYGLDVTSDEVVKPLSTFFPELVAILEYAKQYPKAISSQNVETRFFDTFTFLVPPAQWFELFKLERSGDEAQDASMLFETFTQYFPGWESYREGDYGTWRFSEFASYLIMRIRFELGDTYLMAFYQHCVKHLSFSALQHMVVSATYDERELIPFIAAPEHYPVRLFDVNNRTWLVLCWPEDLYTELEHSWGPKFSRFIANLILDQFETHNLAKLSFNFNRYNLPNLYALALGLDQSVKREVKARIEARLLVLKYEIAEREQLVKTYENARAREDIALRTRYEREVKWRSGCYKYLKYLLKALDQAERLKELCAAEVARVTGLSAAPAAGPNDSQTDAQTGAQVDAPARPDYAFEA